MLSLSQYDVYIFDCDGVILDSNQLKVSALKSVLNSSVESSAVVEECVNYFKNNFGKSRFHHVDYFINELIPIATTKREFFKAKLLSGYSNKCKELYMSAQITPGFIKFISELQGVKYVASGSEQQELRDVFEKRNLNQFFAQVLGSPTPKARIVEDILRTEKTKNAVMLGDSHADYMAAKKNKIDFRGYLKYSNVEQSMRCLAAKESFKLIEDWASCQ